MKNYWLFFLLCLVPVYVWSQDIEPGNNAIYPVYGHNETYGPGWGNDEYVPTKNNIYRYLIQLDPDYDGDVDSVDSGLGGGNVSSAGSASAGEFAIFSDPFNIEGYNSTKVRESLSVEVNSTADQNATEILALIKTVDGSGSGLDADLVDGASPFEGDNETYGPGWDDDNKTPEKDDIYDYLHLLDTDDDGDVDSIDAVLGSGDVSGPANSTDGHVALFDGATGKTIKDSGLTLSGDNTGDQNATNILNLIKTGDGNGSGLDADLVDGNNPGTAFVRNVEDNMTDGDSLPDGHAIKVYGDANWGVTGFWNDAGQYIYPDAGTGYRLLDAGTDLATVTFSANTIYILSPGATYDVATSIILANDYTTIIGNGATIRKTATADALRITGNHCRIVGVNINGNSQDWAGIFIWGSYNVLDGVTSYSNGGHGIGQDGQASTCIGNRIVNCTSFSNSGIGFSLNDVDYAVVSNNMAYNNALEGFTCDANSPGWAYGCVFDGNTAYNNTGGVGGFGIDRAEYCVFSNNIIDSSGSNDGMKTQNSEGPVQYCVFSGNTLLNNGGYGINIATGAGGTSNHNKLVGNAYYNNTSGEYYVVSGQDNIIIEIALGDVSGPANSTDGHVALFDGETGKLLKDSGLTLSGDNTGDQNATVVLALLKTVDGDGSGLDADTVDGVNVEGWIDDGQYIYPESGSRYQILDEGTDLSTLSYSDNTTFVLVPGATYDISTTIGITNDYVTIIGYGATIRKTAAAMLQINADHCKLIGFTLDGNSKAYCNIIIQGSYNLIDGVTSHSGEFGISLDGAITTCQYNKVVNCTTYSNWIVGISVWKSSYNVIANNTSRGNGAENFTCDGDASKNVYGNVFSNNLAINSLANAGIGMDSAHYCIFVGNHCSSNALSGIATHDIESPCSYNTYTGNTLSNNGNYGIKLTSDGGTPVTYSKLVGNIYYGNAWGTYYAPSATNAIIETSSAGIASVQEDTDPHLGGALTCDNHNILMENNVNGVVFKNHAGTDWIWGLYVNQYDGTHIGSCGQDVVLGYNCASDNPVRIRVNGFNSQRILLSPNTDANGRHYLVIE